MQFQNRPDVFIHDQLVFGREFDWPTLLALFLVAAFFVVPQLTGHALTARARFCLLGAVWLLVIKLLLRLTQIVLVCVELFSLRTGGRAFAPAGGDSFAGMMAQLFFPILEGGTLLMAMVLFATGLTNLLRRKERWEE
jgi:hypothetical protein